MQRSLNARIVLAFFSFCLALGLVVAAPSAPAIADEPSFTTGIFTVMAKNYEPTEITWNFEAPGGSAKVEINQWVGHIRDYGCNRGPDNDDGRYPCDQGQQNESFTLYLNNELIMTASDFGEDDSRSFEPLYLTLQSGTNTIRVVHTFAGEGPTAESVDGEICIYWQSPTATVPPTDTVPPTNTATPTATQTQPTLTPPPSDPVTPTIPRGGDNPTPTNTPTPANPCPVGKFKVSGGAHSTCDENAPAVQFAYSAFYTIDRSKQDGMPRNDDGSIAPFWDAGYAREVVPVPAGWSPQAARDELYKFAESQGLAHNYFTLSTYNEATGLLTTKLTWAQFRAVFGGGEFTSLWLEAIDPGRPGCPEWHILSVSAHWFPCPQGTPIPTGVPELSPTIPPIPGITPTPLAGSSVVFGNQPAFTWGIAQTAWCMFALGIAGAIVFFAVRSNKRPRRK